MSSGLAFLVDLRGNEVCLEFLPILVGGRFVIPFFTALAKMCDFVIIIFPILIICLFVS